MERTQRPKPLAFILIRRGPGSGQIHTITREKTTIGRLKKNTIVILDKEVSREHAVISLVNDRFFLKDAGSTNGTALNDTAIAGSVPLKHGDTITLGPNILLTFLCELPGEEKTPAKIARYIPILLPFLAVLMFSLLITFALSLEPQPSRTTAHILSPAPGTTIPSEETTLLAAGRSDLPITRVEMWLDGNLIEQYTNLEGNSAPVYLQSEREIRGTGQHTLLVRVFDSVGNRSFSEIVFSVSPSEADDGDGVPAEIDRCPETAGSITAEGCPDVDFDTIPDDMDVCPQIPGVYPAAGCPIPTEEDQDGDGLDDAEDECPLKPGPGITYGCPDQDGDLIPDEADTCPGEAGSAAFSGCPPADNLDGDMLPDSEDRCPDKAGKPELSGCPDKDGDGVQDDDDFCPTQAGDTETDGCPDRDSDGTADQEDFCPNTAGAVESAGCKPGDDVDSDSDTVPDFLDLCPEENGDTELAGCAAPGTAPDENNNGIADDQQLLSSLPVSSLLSSWILQIPEDLTFVELEIISVDTTDSLSAITCEIRTEDPIHTFQKMDIELSEQDQDSSQTGQGSQQNSYGSVSLFANSQETLTLNMQCSTMRDNELVSLGTIQPVLLPSDRNGDVIQSMSSPFNGEEPLIFEYRACEGGCSSVNEPYPPAAFLYTTGSHSWLFWEDMPGQDVPEMYNLYLNESLSWSIPAGTHGLRLDITPPCGQSWDLYLTNVTDGAESAPGNRITLQGETCEQSVRIRFKTLELPESAAGTDMDRDTGPLRGIFFAGSGAEYQVLPWSAAWTNQGDIGRKNCSAGGFGITESSTSIQELFDWIDSQEEGPAAGSGVVSGVDSYYSHQLIAADLPELAIAVDPGQALTIGARIEEFHCPGGYEEIILNVVEIFETLPEGTVELEGSGAVLVIEVEYLE